VACGQAKRRIHRKRREDKVAKGQMRSNREKKKPKAEKNKKKSASVPLVFERVRMIGKNASDKKFS
jgi:hypothetical protein